MIYRSDSDSFDQAGSTSYGRVGCACTRTELKRPSTLTRAVQNPASERRAVVLTTTVSEPVAVALLVRSAPPCRRPAPVGVVDAGGAALLPSTWLRKDQRGVGTPAWVCEMVSREERRRLTGGGDWRWPRNKLTVAASDIDRQPIPEVPPLLARSLDGAGAAQRAWHTVVPLVAGVLEEGLVAQAHR